MNARWLQQAAEMGTGRELNYEADERFRRTRRERCWAWVSLFVLIVAWDAAGRLDERVALPRMRIAHAAGDGGHAPQRIESTDL
jgi:hypothetical protein